VSANEQLKDELYVVYQLGYEKGKKVGRLIYQDEIYPSLIGIDRLMRHGHRTFLTPKGTK